MSLVPGLERIRVVLIEPSHPGNIGAAARAMKTMGLSRLVLVRPRSFPDPAAIARAAGAADVLEAAEIRESLGEALQNTTFVVGLSARLRDLAPVELDLRAAAGQIAAEAAAGEVAVMFGRERTGLGIAEVSRCHRLVRIDSNPAYASLNLAAAVQVVGYELRRAVLQEVRVERSDRPLATHEDVERLVDHLERTMLCTGFLDASRPGRLTQRMRRMFMRARLEQEEVAILRGFLHSIADGRRGAVQSAPIES